MRVRIASRALRASECFLLNFVVQDRNASRSKRCEREIDPSKWRGHRAVSRQKVSVRPASILLAAGVMTCALAGCGGAKSKPATTTSPAATAAGAATPESKLSYKTQVLTADHQLSGALRTLQSLAATSIVYPAPPRAALGAAATLEKTQGTLRDAVRRLDAMTPPAAIQSENVELSQGARLLTSELGVTIKQLREGVLHAAGSLPTLSGAEQMRRAWAAISEQGYWSGSP